MVNLELAFILHVDYDIDDDDGDGGGDDDDDDDDGGGDDDDNHNDGDDDDDGGGGDDDDNHDDGDDSDDDHLVVTVILSLSLLYVLHNNRRGSVLSSDVLQSSTDSISYKATT